MQIGLSFWSLFCEVLEGLRSGFLSKPSTTDKVKNSQFWLEFGRDTTEDGNPYSHANSEHKQEESYQYREKDKYRP